MRLQYDTDVIGHMMRLQYDTDVNLIAVLLNIRSRFSKYLLHGNERSSHVFMNIQFEYTMTNVYYLM